MEKMYIPGNQIVLRDWQMDDLSTYAPWLQPGHRWQELDGPYYPGPGEAEIVEIIGRLRTRIENGDLDEPRRAMASARRQSNQLVGRLNWYLQSKAEGPKWISVGIAIFDPADWGRSLGYEALGLWSDYLWQAMPSIVRLDIRTWSGNQGMMALAEKLGYVEEARFRQARFVNGNYYDSVGYGVLREEWMARYPAGFAAHLRSVDSEQ
jgi:putative hydrolase of HD superfamily